MLLLKNNKRGFTAVEIAMVASVIAILALLVLPIFRERAESARVAAAHDEMSSIVKMALLVEADLPGGDYLVQLNDMDNVSYKSNPSTANGNAPEIEPSRYKWKRATGIFARLDDTQYASQTLLNWDGPYLALPRGFERNKTITMDELRLTFPAMTNQAGFFGPITIPNGTPWNTAALQRDRYPLDPWGTPYLLWGPTETAYNSRLLISLGPNGVPGGVINPTPQDFSRQQGVVGTIDDIPYPF